MQALLILGNTQSIPDLLKILGLEVSSDLIYLELESRKILVVPQLEYSRLNQALGDRMELIPRGDFNSKDNLQIIQALAQRFSISQFKIHPRMSFQLASKLQELGFELKIWDPVEIRRPKQDWEISRIQRAARIAAQGIKLVAKLAKPGRSVDEIRKQLLKFMLDRGADPKLENPIISQGKLSGNPHEIGHGKIKSNQHLVVDIFPRYRGYYADLTRTLSLGEIDPQIMDMHSVSLEALIQSQRMLKPQQDCCQIYFKICEVIESHGYSSLRKDPKSIRGFIHSGGHGIGLELHEPPNIGENEQRLMEGDVITLEPGIYDPELGGVRIEQDYLIQSNGSKPLVKLTPELIKLR